MLLILARQAIGDGIKAGRDLSATYPMLKAIEVVEDYARHLEKAAENAVKSKPLPTLDESFGASIAQGLKPDPAQVHAQKIQLSLRGSTDVIDNTAPIKGHD
jgi:hypothetical protein